jgi:hypothetical protein
MSATIRSRVGSASTVIPGPFRVGIIVTAVTIAEGAYRRLTRAERAPTS